MDDTIIATYCLCDDLLHAMHHQDDSHQQMTDAEVMTTALGAACSFRGNFESARLLLKTYGSIPQMLSKSRLGRRLHHRKDLFLFLFHVLSFLWKRLHGASIYVVDRFPIAVCDNYRIPQAKLYQGALFRGAIPSKQRYFYGLKVHLMLTQDGEPIEFFLTPGSWSETDGLKYGLKYCTFDLPAGSIVYGDKASNHSEIEDLLIEASHITLLP